MIILGVVLLLIGILAGIPILTTIGTILLVVGAILFILGSVGRPVGGRRYWY
jgi:Zn-dependent membrane protease YugP